jgi:hypothetical protein
MSAADFGHGTDDDSFDELERSSIIILQFGQAAGRSVPTRVRDIEVEERLVSFFVALF